MKYVSLYLLFFIMTFNVFPSEKIERPFKGNAGYFLYVNFTLGPTKGVMKQSVVLNYEDNKAVYYVGLGDKKKIIGKFDKGIFTGKLKTDTGVLIFNGKVVIEKDTNKKIIEGKLTGQNLNGHEIKGIFKIK